MKVVLKYLLVVAALVAGMWDAEARAVSLSYVGTDYDLTNLYPAAVRRRLCRRAVAERLSRQAARRRREQRLRLGRIRSLRHAFRLPQRERHWRQRLRQSDRQLGLSEHHQPAELRERFADPVEPQGWRLGLLADRRSATHQWRPRLELGRHADALFERPSPLREDGHSRRHGNDYRQRSRGGAGRTLGLSSRRRRAGEVPRERDDRRPRLRRSGRRPKC